MRSFKVMGVMIALFAVMAMGAECDPGYCGDGVCSGGETAYSCPGDCDYCGNGICSTLEGRVSCPEDCGDITPICDYDGRCESGENANSCYDDCGRCGDGNCTGPEDSNWCAVDCGCPYNFPLACGGDCWACNYTTDFAACCGGYFITCSGYYPYYCPIDGGCYSYPCAGWEYYCDYVGYGC